MFCLVTTVSPSSIDCVYTIFFPKGEEGQAGPSGAPGSAGDPGTQGDKGPQGDEGSEVGKCYCRCPSLFNKAIPSSPVYE